jgi:hypothetical protein
MTALVQQPQSSAAFTRPVGPYLSTTVSRSQYMIRTPSRWREVIRDLEPLRHLQENWDGLGAAAPTVSVAKSAIELAKLLADREIDIPTSAVATPAGSILFAWEGSEYFEIEIREPYRAEWMYVDTNGVCTHGQIR